MRKSTTLATLAFALLAILPAAAAPTWLTDLDEAKKVAAKEKKDILVDFTGSDWCGWCIKLKKEVFDLPAFEVATKKFVLVELDFPNKKPQSDEVKAKNRAAQQKYGITGFPSILLMDAQGEVYARTGYQAGGPEKYVAHLQELTKQNTPEGKKALAAEAKVASEAGAKRAAASAKVKAAIEAKDFAAGSVAYDEMFGAVSGPQKAMLNMNKAILSLRIDADNKERALKLIDAALVDAAGNESLVTRIQADREKVAAGENPFAPKAVAPKSGSAPATKAGTAAKKSAAGA
jgi:thioredoxin-related protein